MQTAPPYRRTCDRYSKGTVSDANIVDEIALFVCPASRGKGTRIFEESQDLKPVEATLFENSVVLQRYEIKK